MFVIRITYREHMTMWLSMSPLKHIQNYTQQTADIAQTYNRNQETQLKPMIDGDNVYTLRHYLSRLKNMHTQNYNIKECDLFRD